ncbi:MAG: disulfide bond formation protein B [Rhizobiaceae bacterium]
MISLSRTQYSFLLLAGMIAVIATVLGFQHIGGYIPCKLCLEQREPYYVAIPVAFVALIGAAMSWPQIVTRIFLGLAGALMLYTAYLAAFHSGVEWDWWPGPTDCGATAGNISSDVSDLLGDLSATQPPSCDEAAGRFLGLSFAGWNVFVSLLLAGIAFKAMFATNGKA